LPGNKLYFRPGEKPESLPSASSQAPAEDWIEKHQDISPAPTYTTASQAAAKWLQAHYGAGLRRLGLAKQQNSLKPHL
jgi:hypothetical protein